MIAIEGSAVNFDEVLDIFKQKNRESDCRLYSCVRIIIMIGDSWGGRSDLWGGYPPFPPFCMKHWLGSMYRHHKLGMSQAGKRR